MADPTVVKISALMELSSPAIDDLVTAVDVSETNTAIKTKKLRLDKIPVSNADQLGNGIVTESKLAAASVSETKLASDAVTTAKIRDGQVTNAKLAGSITEDKITSLPTSKLTGTVTAAQLAGNITEDKITSLPDAKVTGKQRGLTIPLFGESDPVVAKLITNKVFWPTLMNGWKITGLRATLAAPSPNAATTVQVKTGSSVIGTLTVAAGGYISPVVTMAYSMNSNNALSFNITAVGSGASGLTVEITATQG